MLFLFSAIFSLSFTSKQLQHVCVIFCYCTLNFTSLRKAYVSRGGVVMCSE